jgi:hypothetical protein
MVHHPKLELARSILRQRVCVKCYLRPPGSENVAPTVMRACEGDCPIFLSLPTLLRIDMQTEDKSLGGYQLAVRDLVCQTCMASDTAGDFCVGQMTRTCPLSLYLGEAMEALSKITALHRPMPQNITVVVNKTAKAPAKAQETKT